MPLRHSHDSPARAKRAHVIVPAVESQAAPGCLASSAAQTPTAPESNATEQVPPPTTQTSSSGIPQTSLNTSLPNMSSDLGKERLPGSDAPVSVRVNYGNFPSPLKYYERKGTKPGPAAEAQHSLNVAASALRYLKNRGASKPFINGQDMENLRLQLSYLDWNTGRPSNGEGLLKPLEHREVAGLAKHFRLHRYQGFSRPLDGLMGNWYSARVMSVFFRNLLELHDQVVEDEKVGRDPTCPDPLRIYGFSIRGPRAEMLDYVTNDAQWNARFIMENTDSARPHHTCFLIDNDLRKNDVLCFSEVWCIAMLGSSKHLRDTDGVHRIIPVTVVSCSSHQVRIVQGYSDGRTESMQIRMSPLISLEGGSHKNWEGCLLILSWLLGKPVGNTG